MAKTYSFEEVSVTLQHPSLGNLSTNGLGVGSVSSNSAEERSKITVSADGNPVTSKIKNSTGGLSLTIQQTSEIHASLKKWFNYLYAATSAEWAQMLIIVTSKSTGEQDVHTGVSFIKLPEKTYESEAGNVTWEFLSSNVQQNIV